MATEQGTTDARGKYPKRDRERHQSTPCGRAEGCQKNLEIELDGLKLYDKEDAMLRKRLQKEAMDEVERHAGILGLSETTRKSLIRGVVKVINGNFHGAPFSSRIWANKNELVARLQVGLERSLLQGEHPDRWARLFTDLVSAEMGETAGRALFAARRLAITESARVMSEIQLNSFEKGGFTKYIWITEMDERTCPVCSALDEEVFDIDRSEIGANLPPLHPFCRCSIAAFVDEPVQDVFSKEKERHYAKDVENQSSNSLKRGIISYTKRIAEHEDKINNPDKYYLDWNKVPDNVKNGRLKHWRKEIDNFKQSIEDNLWELRRRNDER